MLTRKIVDIIAKLNNPRTRNREKYTAEGLKLLEICDILHKGGKYRNYEPPTDEKYEELKTVLGVADSVEIEQNDGEQLTEEPPAVELNNSDEAQLLNELTQIEINTKTDNIQQKYIRKKTNRNTETQNYVKNNNNSPLLIMDGIILPKEIPKLKNALILPKFDGCTVAISITRENSQIIAHTRGIDSLTGDRNIRYVSNKIAHLINSAEMFGALDSVESLTINAKDLTKTGNTNETIPREIFTKNINEIRLRAEVVKRDKLTEECASAFVAGAINGKYETFLSKLPNLCLRFFEIGLIITRDESGENSGKAVHIVPTQLDALKILKLMNVLEFEAIECEDVEKFDFLATFERLKEEFKEPLDGLVYCSKNWTYPYYPEESSKRINYDKYKYKKNNIKQTILRGISWKIGASGKFTATLHYDPIEIEGKTYKQAKMAIGRIESFGQLYKGEAIDIELKANINPMVVNAYNTAKINENKEPLTILKNCIHCGQSLTRNENKAGEITIFCTNLNCVGIIREKIVKFLNAIGFKGISTKTLENNNVKTLSEVPFKEKTKIKDILRGLTLSGYLIACGVITKSKAEKLGDLGNSVEWVKIREELEKYTASDPFVSQVIEFAFSVLSS